MITPVARINTVRRARTRRSLAILAPVVLGALLSAVPAVTHAQAALGVPYIGSNHLSFYATELATDGVGEAKSTLFGARYGRQFGNVQAKSHVAANVQLAVRTLGGPSDALVDASITTSWTRRMDEVTSRLSLAIGAGAGVLAWGLEDDSIGIARVSVPVSLGMSYDVTVGSATFTPFVAPGMAYYRARHYINDVRVGDEDGWDARVTSGASLRLKEVVLSASTIRGEKGLPHGSRWTFAAGISF